MAKIRADVLMVQQGLAESRELARRLIMAGQARAGTTTLVKPGTLLREDTALELVAPPRFVSRGGEKLDAALDHFDIRVEGLRGLDLGASTGGFTDCLLHRGATSVLAIDVGRAQLHQRLREDPRVTLLEGTNARDLPPLGPVDIVVADLSFISLRKVLTSVARRTPAGTPGVYLLKPQFEAGPRDVPRGGVVKDPGVRQRVVAEFRDWATTAGWLPSEPFECPVRGARGNIEYLLLLTSPGAESPDAQ